MTVNISLPPRITISTSLLSLESLTTCSVPLLCLEHHPGHHVSPVRPITSFWISIGISIHQEWPQVRRDKGAMQMSSNSDQMRLISVILEARRRPFSRLAGARKPQAHRHSTSCTVGVSRARQSPAKEGQSITQDDRYMKEEASFVDGIVSIC